MFFAHAEKKADVGIFFMFMSAAVKRQGTY